jgi:hypothetical protein
MATTKARTIKLTDLTTAIDKAVAASAGKKFPGPIIMGRVITKAQAANIDVNAVARDVTRQVAQTVSGVKLTPKVILDGGVITMGFIMKPVEFDQ